LEEIEKGKLDVSTAPAVTVPRETTLDFSHSILTSTQMKERSETANQQSLRGVGPYGP